MKDSLRQALERWLIVKDVSEWLAPEEHATEAEQAWEALRSELVEFIKDTARKT